jgi:hypothetical protein
MTTRLERLGAQALLAGRPALNAEPVAPLGIPTSNLEVHVAAHRTPSFTLDAKSGARG